MDGTDLISRAVLSSIAVYMSFLCLKVIHQFEPITLTIVTTIMSLFPMGLGLYWIWSADDLTELTICLSMIALSPLLVTVAAVIYLGVNICLYSYAVVLFLLETASTWGVVSIGVMLCGAIGYAWIRLSAYDEDWEMRRGWR